MTDTELAGSRATAGAIGQISLRRTLASMAVLAGMVAALSQGNGFVLGPIQVEHLDNGHKVAALGLVAGLSSVAGLICGPIAGALSDRTRSRFGRRAPWLVAGAIGQFALLVLLARAQSIAMVIVFSCLIAVVAGAYVAPLTALIPDRIPVARRGVASAVWGVATVIGSVVGVGIGSLFASHYGAGFIVLGGVLVVATAFFLVAAPEQSAADLPVPPRDTRPLGARLGAFVSAMRNRDFALVFASRAAINLGLNLVASYDLYILTDYIKVPRGMTPARGVTVIAAITAVGAIIAAATAGPLSDRINRRKPFVFAAAAISGAGCLVPALWPSWGTIEIFAAFAGLALGSYLAVDSALVTLVLPAQETAARDLGVLNVAASGPPVVAPLIAAFIILHVGGYQPLFFVSGALAVLGAFIVLGVRSVR